MDVGGTHRLLLDFLSGVLSEVLSEVRFLLSSLLLLVAFFLSAKCTHKCKTALDA